MLKTIHPTPCELPKKIGTRFVGCDEIFIFIHLGSAIGIEKTGAYESKTANQKTNRTKKVEKWKETFA